MDAGRFVRRFHEEVLILEPAPGEPLQALDGEFHRVVSSDEGLEDFLEVLRIQPGDDARLLVNVVRNLVEPAVGGEASVGVVNLKGPRDSFLIAFPHEFDDILTWQGPDSQELSVNSDAVSTIANHVPDAALLHVGAGQRFRPSGGEA